MSEIAALVSDHLDIWTAATERKKGAGRRGGKRVSFHGIERLRALILDLALRGRLVSQITSDEPASDLMKRVGQDRAALGGKVSKADAVAPPADLPVGWVAVRLADLANPQAGFAFKSVGFNELGVGLPLIRIRDVGQPFTGTFYSSGYRDEFVVQEGDYLVSMDGEFRVARWDGPNALLNQRVARLQFYGDEVVRPFVAMALQTELTQLQGVKAYTTVDHLSGKQIAGSVIRLPPLAEQGRIVARVDELMALCDALEGESAAALAAHHTLVETLLATLASSADAADLAANWTRLEAHFDTLFTTEGSIDALTQTILQLAVSGGLSPVDRWPQAPVSLKSSASLQNGYAFKSDWFAQDGIRLLRNINITHGSTDWSETVCLPEKDANAFSRFMLNERDIVLTLDRPFISTGTKVAQIVASDLPALLLQRVGRFLISEHLIPEYVFLWVNSPMFSKQIDPGRSNGVPHISTKQVEAAMIFIPSTDEQKSIVAKVGALMAICDELKAGITEAGQIQTRLADAIVERAAA